MYNISSSNSMSTPGVSGSNYTLDSQQPLGSARMASNGHTPSSLGVAAGSQMIPTPGLNTSQGLGMAPASSCGLGLPHGGVGVGQLQQHQFGVGPGNRMFDGINGQLSGGLASVVQQQRKPGSSVGMGNGGLNNGTVLGNGQHLMNGSPNLHSPASFLNTSQYSSLQLQQQQQRMSQQQQQQQQQQHQHQRSQNLRIQRKPCNVGSVPFTCSFSHS